MRLSSLVATASFSISICGAVIADLSREDTTSIKADAAISAVTVYPGRASITRTTALDLEPGLYEIQFENLPQTLDSNSLQARATGPAKILGVDFEVKAVAQAPSPRVAELDKQIEQVAQAIARIDEQHKINAAQGKLIDDISVRVAHDATENGGTETLDLETLGRQIEFTAQQREKLATARLALDQERKILQERLHLLQTERNSIAPESKSDRIATVTAVVGAPSQIGIELVYLVTDATWEPSYNIRAADDGSNVTIEYEAMLAQRTGEDWDDVKMTLSTAQPTLAANPPALQAWFVDVVREADKSFASKSPGFESRKSELSDRNTDAMRGRVVLGDIPVAESGGEAGVIDGQEAPWQTARERLDAQVAGQGPSVTFELPLRVTVKTSAQKQQRTRIASFQTAPEFVHVAVPALTPAVYICGELTNSSAYQLLPGRASIFVGQDFVGPTWMASIAPGSEFEVHFGIDQAVKASRQLVRKNTSRTGLFNGGVRTTYDYRLAIDNGTGKSIAVELWDRIPVSRFEQLKIEATDLSRPLATDTEFVEQHKLRGMLKWEQSVPAGATGKSEFVTTYTLRVDRDKDVLHTPLPE